MINRKHLIPYAVGLFIVILFADQSGPMEGVSVFFAWVSAILFFVANAYYPARLIAREFKPLPKPVVAFFRKYLKAHVWMNLVAFVTMVIHCHYSEEMNLLLVATYLVTIYLTVEGIVMHYRLIPEEQKLLRLLHTQQTLFVVWIVLIFLAHWD